MQYCLMFLVPGTWYSSTPYRVVQVRAIVSWADKITMDSNGTSNGTVFYSQVIRIIWQYILDIWKLRNADLHSPQLLQHLSQNILAHQVQQIFHQMHMDPLLQPIAPSITVDQVLHRPPSAI